MDVGIHQELPRDGQCAEGDDGGIRVVLAPSGVVRVSSEPEDTGEDERVPGQVEGVGDRRDRHRQMEDLVVDGLGGIAEGEAGSSKGNEEPAQPIVGMVQANADQDADHRGYADELVHGVLTGRTGKREVPGDHANAADQDVLPQMVSHSGIPLGGR